MSTPRNPYPGEVTDAEWDFLLQTNEHAPQWAHNLREVFNALRYVAQTSYRWCMLPHDLPGWTVAYTDGWPPCLPFGMGSPSSACSSIN
ncbi:MAG: transposase [Gemmataceae bacterium]